MLSENEAILHFHLTTAEDERDEARREVEMLRRSLETMREAKTAELFGRTPEAWLDIECIVREALSKGYGRAEWRQRARKALWP